MRRLLILIALLIPLTHCNAQQASDLGDNVLLFTGSSTIHLWSGVVDDFSEFNAKNSGISGSTIVQLQENIDKIVFAYNPSQMVLYIGDNDAFELSIEDFCEKIDTYIASIYDHLPNMHLIIVSIKPSPARVANFEKYVAFNAKFKVLSELDDKIDYVDFWTPLLGNGAGDASYFLDDRLHLNQKGYELLTKLIKEKLVH